MDINEGSVIGNVNLQSTTVTVRVIASVGVEVFVAVEFTIQCIQ